MSFNLNKNEVAMASSKKPGFDLSKSGPEAKKPKYWLFAMIVVLVIGGIAWYLFKPAGTVNAAAEPVQAVTVVPATDTAAGGLKPDTALIGPEPFGDSAAAIIAASFKAGSVRPRGSIRNIVNTIRQKQKKGSALKISVFGYASSEGNIAFNQSISQARADAYKKLLIVNGIDKGLVNAVGKGIDNPVATNDTEAGRQKNRRVEVSF
jgi:outer membrane protein OmpA-like peptidoglycan-associated protein